jgi:hypothetical protein
LNERKEIFPCPDDAVPLAPISAKGWTNAPATAPKTRFLDELEDHMAEDAARRGLKTIVKGAVRRVFQLDDDAACSPGEPGLKRFAAYAAQLAPLAKSNAQRALRQRAFDFQLPP